jgi:tetratricopeptide (TPR) repeat protein
MQRALGIDPDDPFTRSNVIALSMAGKEETARQNFQDGNKAFDKALYRKARDLYLKALEEDSLFFEARINLAYSYIHLGDVDKAAVSFEKAAQIRPDHPLAYIGWGDALLGMGQINKAIEKYKKATELEPDDSEIAKIYRDAMDLRDSLGISADE